MFALGFACPALAADPSARDFAARTEIFDIHTLTLSDKQFLTGDAEAKATVTSGKLRVAQGEGKLPVVVLVHGSGGMGTNIELWERTFNAMGVSTFALDGFTGRGLTQTSTNQALLGRLNFILDIYRGLDVLAKHPRVDPQRIVLMGFSRGGQAALYASLKRFHQLWNKSGVEFAAYIPFYPDCATDLRRRHRHRRPADPHLRRHAGRLQSDRAVQGLRRAAQGGRPRRARSPNIRTRRIRFDSPLGAQPPIVSPKSQSVRACKIREEAGGVLIERLDRPAVQLQGCLRRVRPASRLTIRRRRGRSSRR